MTTLREQLAALRLRISGAESQRDAWRAAGSMEKYLEACSLVDALELQLASLEASAQTTAPAARVAEPRICYDGRSYQYRGYRYDRFIDAVNYARLDCARGFSDAAGGDAVTGQAPAPPSEAECALMQALAITFEDGTFRWREYRYDRLADAVAYATLQKGG